MSLPFRVIDTGVRPGRRQIALDAALIELHRAGRSPDTLRFLRFPPTVLVGRHQALGREVNLTHCRAEGIGLVRRVTGGGAIYLDEGQVGWEVVASRRRLAAAQRGQTHGSDPAPVPSLAAWAAIISEAVAHGLSDAFGIAARFRPPSDIEVDGRKLSGTGGFFDGDTLVWQGTVLVDVEPARIARCLNLPASAPGAATSAPRMTTLKALLGGEAPDVFAVHQAIVLGLSAKLGIEPRHGSTSPEEEALAAKLYDEEIGTDAFVHSIDDPRGAGILEATARGPGGTVTAFVRLEGDRGSRRIREVLVAGDFFCQPARTILDLEAALRGVALVDVAATVDRFLAAAKPAMLTAPVERIRSAIIDAIASEPAA